MALTADIGLALPAHDTVAPMLQACADIFANHLDLKFAGFWIRSEGYGSLELRGRHGRQEADDVAELTSLFEVVLSGSPASNLELVQRQLEQAAAGWSSRHNNGSVFLRTLTKNNTVLGVAALFGEPLPTDYLDRVDEIMVHIGAVVYRRQEWLQLLARNEILDRFASEVRVVFWILSLDMSHFWYVSPSYEKLNGRSVEALYQNPLDFMEAVVEQDRPKLLEHFEKELLPSGSNVEYRIVHADGSLRDIWVLSFPSLDQDGNPLCRCGIALDVTERKENERRVREFYSMVSHELRTPLTAIRAALGLVEGGVIAQLPPDVLDLIHIARSESDRLIRLVNSILDLRKMEAGKLEFAIGEIDPSDLIYSSIAVMRSMAREAHIELVSSVDDPHLILGDRDRVIQVLTNIISNAIKFAPKQTRVAVRVHSSEQPGFLRFSVTDQGPGIPESSVSKLFGLFQQLDSSDARAQGGSGLGLAISKAIVERLGGKIGVETAAGRGSTFWFELPAAERLAADRKSN